MSYRLDDQSIREAWSDAARKAAAAGRKARKQGKSLSAVKAAARAAYVRSGGSATGFPRVGQRIISDIYHPGGSATVTKRGKSGSITYRRDAIHQERTGRRLYAAQNYTVGTDQKRKIKRSR